MRMPLIQKEFIPLIRFCFSMKGIRFENKFSNTQVLCLLFEIMPRKTT